MIVSRQRRHPSRSPPDRLKARFVGRSSPTLRPLAGCRACAASDETAAVAATSATNSRCRRSVPSSDDSIACAEKVLRSELKQIGAVPSQCLTRVQEAKLAEFIGMSAWTSKAGRSPDIGSVKPNDPENRQSAQLSSQYRVISSRLFDGR
jgi:hypothetical protein